MKDNISRVIPLPSAENSHDEWDPGFEGDRWIIVSRLGSRVKLFKRPPEYRKRFFHHLYNLPVRDWSIPCEAQFLAGLCTIKANIDVRFQPTLRYVTRNIESLPDVSSHIQLNYESLIKDVVERELVYAEEKGWIKAGLESIERAIDKAINESLAAQNIQCRTRCALEPIFKELTEDELNSMSGHFERQSAYLELMRRNQEFQSYRQMEIHRQEEEAEKANLEHQRKLLDQFRRDESVRQAKDREETDREVTRLSEEEKRQSARHASEERRHIERIEHERLLRKKELEAKTREREMRLQATKDSDDILRHEIELLVLEKQRHNLEEEVEDVVRDWDRRKIQERAVASGDRDQRIAIPAPELPEVEQEN